MARQILPMSLIVIFAAAAPAMADARPLTADRLTPARDDPDSYLIDGRYQRGEARLARMRRNGALPDAIRAQGCHFDLAGDVGVAYYVKSCP